MAYVEVKAKTVELAVEAAMAELKVTDRNTIEVKVIQEPERGFLGFGGQDAIVRVEEKKETSKSRRSRRSRSKKGDKADSSGRSARGNQSGEKQGAKGNGNNGGQKRANGGGKPQQTPKSDKNDRPRNAKPKQQQQQKSADDREEIGVDSQEPMVKDFLSGLVQAFGLEGEVETRIEDDVVVANVVGEQTEALVGPRGSVMEAVHELTKTVLQRSVQDSARVRIDIAGYAERRRQALTIYAGELIDQVLDDGGELMLEPMAASDRKVIHDAVGAREGVRSYSEGESPKRYVVIAPTEENETPGSDEEE